MNESVPETAKISVKWRRVSYALLVFGGLAVTGCGLWLKARLVDPFGDNPLRYKTNGLGYRIYSIGPDYEDNNGKEETANMKESDHYDIVFSVTH